MQTKYSEARLFLFFVVQLSFGVWFGICQELENWVTADFDATDGPILIENSNTTSRPLLGPLPISCCENGWIRFENSCYLAVRQRMNFDAAEHYCYSRSATLFVADSVKEWDTIRTISPNGFISWLGLANFGQGALWQTKNGMDISYLNWAAPTGNEYANGWTQYAICGGHFNAIDGGHSYVRYYVCSTPLFAICERNITHINLQLYLSEQKKIQRNNKNL
uniref:C-type lectin domain-containing protein n=1 Tax=Acrobeloides nanus TaxID=290746 RepID=A0A914C9D8_9BILA